MKLSIEATDKLENKDFHYELIVSQTHVAMVCGTVLASLALMAWMNLSISDAGFCISRSEWCKDSLSVSEMFF